MSDYNESEFNALKAQKDAIISTQQEFYEQMKTAYYEACTELEQVKAERDELKEENGDLKDAMERQLDYELHSLRTELSEKDKVLERYANGLFDWKPAHKILSQYAEEEKK